MSSTPCSRSVKFALFLGLSLVGGCARPNSLPRRASAETGKTAEAPVVYRNAQYGFSVSLPKSWKGYSADIEHEVRGVFYPETGRSGTEEPLVEVSIEPPLSRSEDLLQPIVITVYTHDQWRMEQSGILWRNPQTNGLSELGRNAKYVFVAPHYVEELTGHEEVDAIVMNMPLEAFPPAEN